MSAKTQTAQDSEFCDEVWQILKSDSNDLRKQKAILEAHRKVMQAAIAARLGIIEGLEMADQKLNVLMLGLPMHGPKAQALLEASAAIHALIGEKR